MINGGNNILDMLLGLTAPAGTISQTPGIGGNATPGLFGDIFDLLLQPQSGQMAASNTDTAGTPIMPDLLSHFMAMNGESGETIQNDVTAHPESGVELLTNLSGTTTNAPQMTEGKVFETEANPQVSSSDISVPGVAEQELSAGLPMSGPISNRQLAEIIARNAVPMELPTGSYEVLDASVADGRLVLDVASADDPDGQVIRVSVPATDAMLEHTVDGKATQVSSRVSLEQPQADFNARFEALLSRLNVRELEISQPEPSLTKPQPSADESAQSMVKDTVTFKLVAENAGQEFVIKSNIKRGEVKAETRDTLVSGKTEGGLVSSLRESIKPIDSVEPKDAGPQRQSSQLFGQTVKSDGLSLLDELSKPHETIDGGKQDLQAVSGFERAARFTGAVADKLEIPTARFTLPEDLAGTLKPDGKAVTIKLNPEHLGPARLHVSMHNEMLTARLTVESTQARAAVESSLDQLVEQLARAGIRVNHVEVSVAGGDVGSQLFERRAMWNRQAKSPVTDFDDLSELDGTTRSGVESYQPPAYIGADGVNVLA